MRVWRVFWVLGVCVLGFVFWDLWRGGLVGWGVEGGSIGGGGGVRGEGEEGGCEG